MCSLKVEMFDLLTIPQRRSYYVYSVCFIHSIYFATVTKSTAATATVTTTVTASISYSKFIG